MVPPKGDPTQSILPSDILTDGIPAAAQTLESHPSFNHVRKLAVCRNPNGEVGDISPEISLNPDGGYKLQDDLELSKLDRGIVLEFRGTIRLHPLYRVYRAIEYIDIATPDEADISEGNMRLIEESLGNKIPIEIEVNGLSIDGNGSISEDPQGDAFNVVALLDETELWTEPIQTLASSKQFRIFVV